MAFSPKITLLAALLLLTACRSDPIQFHTLTPAQPARGNGDEIRIEGISVPPQVDRAQIVIRQGNSGLAILETDWWGASLGMSCAVRWLISCPTPIRSAKCRCAWTCSALIRFLGSMV